MKSACPKTVTAEQTQTTLSQWINKASHHEIRLGELPVRRALESLVEMVSDSRTIVYGGKRDAGREGGMKAAGRQEQVRML
jgi:hypothetical protein